MSSIEGPHLNLEDSGISDEDRREISERIEAISLESRIEITPATFAFEGRRRAGVLPFLANVIALVLIAAGVLGAYYLFQQRQAEISTSEGTFTTAEGRLIAELRRQTAEELTAKDQAMGDVRRQLTEVQIERDEILAEIDARVRAREQELRQTLVNEIADERTRLTQAGASESSIQTRLAEIQNSQGVQIETLLATYRTELENEYATNLERLQALQRQYESELQDLQQERLTISRESEQREQALREQIVAQEESTSQETEAARAAAQQAAAEAEAANQALAEAREELSAIAGQENRKALVEAQVNGLYRQIADRVLLGEYPGALARLASLRSLLNDPDFRSLPGISDRVEIDLAVADTLEALIQAQMAARPEQSEAEELVGNLRIAVQRAETLANNGDDAGARDAYLAALRVLPEVSASYDYLLSRQQADADARALDIDAARESAEARATNLENQLAEARTRELRLQDTVADLRTRVTAAQAALDEARSEITSLQERPPDAGADELAAVREQLAAAEAARDAAVADLERATSERARLETSVSQQREQIVSLTNQRDERARQVRELQANVNELNARMEPIQQQADRYEAMIARYNEYTANEDKALAGSGAGTIAEAKLELDAFLTSPEVMGTFPDLFDRFSRYQRAIESEGREAAILELIDVVYNLSAYDTSDERVAFLKSEIDRADAGSFLADFLAELVYLVQ